MGKSIFGRREKKRRLARDANQTDRHNKREAAALKYVTRRRSDMTGGSLALLPVSQLGLPQTTMSLEMHNSMCQSFAVIKIPKLHLIDQRDKQLGIWSKWKQFLCWRRESSAFGNLDTYFILSWLIYGFLCGARILLEYPSSCLSADRGTGTIMPPSLKTYMPFSEALFLFHSFTYSQPYLKVVPLLRVSWRPLPFCVPKWSVSCFPTQCSQQPRPSCTYSS